METYRTAWLCIVVGVVTIGTCTVMMTWSLPAVLGTFLLCGLIGGSLAAARSRELHWQRILLVAAASGLVVLGATGIVLLLGGWVVPVLVLMAVCSPTVLVWAPRLAYWHAHKGTASEFETPRRSMATSAGDGPSIGDVVLEDSEPAPAPAIESMDDASVCLAWRASFLTLQRPLSSASRLRVVERRQEYLDELERRNPRGFSAWLASGARAAGDPSRYILPEGRRDHPDRRV